jgi:membrane-associated phospholipid phosphatase
LQKDAYRTTTLRPYMILAGIGMIGLFLYLTMQVMANKSMWIDTYIQSLLVQPESLGVYTFFRYFTKSGSAIGVCILLALCVIFFYMKDKDMKAILLLPIATLITHFLNVGVKVLIERERPSINPIVDAVGYSFPSGHAMIGIVAYGLSAYLIVQKVRSNSAKQIVIWTSFVFIFLIGISRIILSAHYPTDVIGGYIFGGCILYGCIRLYERR